MNRSPEECLAAGEPQAALAALQAQVRQRASDAKLRVFLFQLLAVLGQWPKALAQLEVCGELDASTLAMVNTYRGAVQCEAVRDAVFAGHTTPMVIGQPQPWVALLVQALQADASHDDAGAARLRAQAFDEAPATPGSIDGQRFAWIADADSRLGPVLEVIVNGRYGWLPFASVQSITLEAPADLRDLVWTPAHLTFSNGGDTVALVPSRYAGTTGESEGALLLARRTEWIALGSDQYRGLGQRLLTTDAAECGLLEVREIALDALG